jgi:hypothetical protein
VLRIFDLQPINRKLQIVVWQGHTETQQELGTRFLVRNHSMLEL